MPKVPSSSNASAIAPATRSLVARLLASACALRNSFSIIITAAMDLWHYGNRDTRGRGHTMACADAKGSLWQICPHKITRLKFQQLFYTKIFTQQWDSLFHKRGMIARCLVEQVVAKNHNRHIYPSAYSHRRANVQVQHTVAVGGGFI